MTPVSAIAFDLDNTLIDRDEAFLGLLIDWLGSCTGKKRSLVDHLLKLDNSGHGSREDLFQHMAELNLPGGNRSGLWNRFQRDFPRYFPPDRDVIELVMRVRKQVPIAILSNGGSTLQRGKLKHSGLDGIFDPDRILISEEIGCRKPEAEAFHLLAERLSLPPENTLFVGDHPEIDIDGAAACGFQTCWFQRKANLSIEPRKFDFSIHSLLELDSICPEKI